MKTQNKLIVIDHDRSSRNANNHELQHLAMIDDEEEIVSKDEEVVRLREQVEELETKVEQLKNLIRLIIKNGWPESHAKICSELLEKY